VMGKPYDFSKNKKFFWGLIILVLCFLLPAAIKSAFYLDMLVKVVFWAMVAGAWNISCGYGGALSLGHTAFFGIGAYVSTILFLQFGLTPWIGMLAGGFLAIFFALALGYLSFRLHGPFFVLSTVAFAEVLRIIAIHWRSVTRGSEGLSIPFKPNWGTFILHNRLQYAYVALCLLLLVFLISYWIERSRFGYQLMAMRGDEDAAESLGINTLQLKIIASSISAFLTALGGTFYAQYIMYIEPHNVLGLDFSVQVALISIIGGMGTAFGPILGSLFITPLSQLLRGWFGGGYVGLHFIIYGMILIIVVMFIPEGIFTAIWGRKERSSFFRDLISKWMNKIGVFKT
jgi:branched-chain amino acid transport system permease protein